MDSTAFLMAGTSARAELWLRQEGRLVTARAEDIVDALFGDALAGVKLGPERLLAMLSGCVTTAPATARVDGAQRSGSLILVPVSDGRVFLATRDGRRRIVAGDTAGTIVDYSSFNGYWPGAFRVAATTPAAGTAVADQVVLDVTVSGVEFNRAAIEPAAFRLAQPSMSRR